MTVFLYSYKGIIVRYYGGKGKLVDFIYETAKDLTNKLNPSIFDLFAGTSVVACHFKRHGYKVYTNDILTFSYYRSVAYIELNSRPKFTLLTRELGTTPIDFLNSLEGKHGFITENYSPAGPCARQYVSIENALKIDVIREHIENWLDAGLINFREYCYLITSLIEAVNLVSNVTGTYAAYLKSWDNRALKKIYLVELEIKDNGMINKSFNQDSNKMEQPLNLDICYLDPPYNGRQYTSNYFFIELIALGWFKTIPSPRGLTGMIDLERKKSSYCSKLNARKSLQELLKKIESPFVMLSYNNEGIIPHDDLIHDLSSHGYLTEVYKTHKRYRAINQDGTVTKTKESIFILER
jgi:adenine-specific DNA-methyltransferase